MATSPLDPANISNRADRILGRGHGTGAATPDGEVKDGADVAPDHIEEVGEDEEGEAGK